MNVGHIPCDVFSLQDETVHATHHCEHLLNLQHPDFSVPGSANIYYSTCKLNIIVYILIIIGDYNGQFILKFTVSFL